MNPRESALPRPVAMRLAATEYDRRHNVIVRLPGRAGPCSCAASG
jgi:hypothetical protein